MSSTKFNVPLKGSRHTRVALAVAIGHRSTGNGRFVMRSSRHKCLQRGWLPTLKLAYARIDLRPVPADAHSQPNDGR